MLLVALSLVALRGTVESAFKKKVCDRKATMSVSHIYVKYLMHAGGWTSVAYLSRGQAKG